MQIERIEARFSRWDDLLELILSAFAYMNGRIDPPSSALALTAGSLRQKAEQEIAFIVRDGTALLGCVFCRPEPPDALYIGKFAVHPDVQGKGIGGLLLKAATRTARTLDLPRLRLETRIELTENHATFQRWGFTRTGEKAHPGFTRVTSIEMQKQLPAE